MFLFVSDLNIRDNSHITVGDAWPFVSKNAQDFSQLLRWGRFLHQCSRRSWKKPRDKSCRNVFELSTSFCFSAGNTPLTLTPAHPVTQISGKGYSDVSEQIYARQELEVLSGGWKASNCFLLQKGEIICKESSPVCFSSRSLELRHKKPVWILVETQSLCFKPFGRQTERTKTQFLNLVFIVFLDILQKWLQKHPKQFKS